DAVTTYGVMFKNVENLDLRLADQAPAGNPTLDRADNLTIALGEQRGVLSRGDVIGPLPAALLHPLALNVNLGAGDDQVQVRQITGPTTILGGPGNDTVTVTSSNSLAGLGATLTF